MEHRFQNNVFPLGRGEEEEGGGGDMQLSISPSSEL